MDNIHGSWTGNTNVLRIGYCHRYLTLTEPAGCRSILNNVVELFRERERDVREWSLFDPVINNIIFYFILTSFYFSHAWSEVQLKYTSSPPIQSLNNYVFCLFCFFSRQLQIKCFVVLQQILLQFSIECALAYCSTEVWGKQWLYWLSDARQSEAN